MLPIISRVAVAAGVLLAPLAASGQSPAPTLDKQQRATLLGLVTAVKDNPTDPIADSEWPVHLFRASDGSHYVAFSAPLPEDVAPETPIAVYVRLVPRESDLATGPGPRSAVEEWLLGERSVPLPMTARRFVDVPTGELPMGGPQTMSGRSARDPSGAQAAAAQSSVALALMDRQRLQEQEAREQRARERKAELEGRAAPQSALFPFEDFDMDARPVARTGKAPAVQRALTTGPGRYELVVAWSASDKPQEPSRTGVLRRQLDLPNIPSGQLALGSIVLADKLGTRAEVFGPDLQAAHPYAIGTTEIEPALDSSFTNDQRMAVAFQVIEAAPGPSGKPDVRIGFHLLRKTPAGEEPAGSFSPLRYDQSTLPEDFDLALGHPILAGMTAPLAKLPRGDYRLVITVSDLVAGSRVSADTRFRIEASAAALLEAAPRLSPTFRREAVIEGDALAGIVARLPSQGASPTLQRRLAAASEGRFVELMTGEQLEGRERGLGLLLQGLGHYALGDSAVTIAARLRGAMEAGGPREVVEYLLGACWALDGQDSEAVAAWNRATAAGWPEALTALPVAEAYARLGQLEQAGRVASGAIADGAGDHALILVAATADIAARREGDALARLDPLLAVSPGDGELQWMAMHALFSGFVRGAGPGATAEGRVRFIALARAYAAGGGRWTSLADEWLALVTSSAP